MGDNLGLNALLGFFESFTSNYPCRVCKAFIDEIKTLTEEKEELIRKKEDYDDDFENETTTGIAEKCFFNRVLGFHVADNFSLDIMHDIFEGFGNLVMVKILRVLIYEKNYFYLDYLNETIEKFSYGTCVEANKILKIKKEHLMEKERLKMSAAELMCFIRYFGLLFYDKVPDKKPMWKLYLKLREIVAIVTSPRLVKGHFARLDSLHKEFLSMYKNMFGDLKFKLHNLIHFLRIIKRNGLLVLFWTMRYESKHRHLKADAISSNSTKNVLKTLALKCQLILAHSCLSQKFWTNNITFENSDPIHALNKHMYFSNAQINEKICTLNFLSVNGIDYAINSVVVLEMGDNNLLKFRKVV